MSGLLAQLFETPPKLVIFDLDGTLVDALAELADAVNAALTALNLETVSQAQVQAWVGNGAAKLLERALQHRLGKQGAELQEPALEYFLAHYQQHLGANTQVYPGVVDYLEQTPAEVTLAIASNKPEKFIAPLLTRLELEHHFSALLGGDSLASKKPHPEPLLYLMERFQVAPQQTLMVGDSVSDVAAARAAGCPVVALSYGFNHGVDIRDSEPDAVIDSLLELL